MARKADNGHAEAAPRPGGTFDFAQMLAIADALPMALAYVDTDLRYRFVNQALAEFVNRPRAEMIGRTMAEVLDPLVMADRRPMLDAALAGERMWFAADYDHPARGMLAIQSEYLPQVDGDFRQREQFIVFENAPDGYGLAKIRLVLKPVDMDVEMAERIGVDIPCFQQRQEC